AVVGGITFTSLGAGGVHTCGIASGSGAAYCWGYNKAGELGIGSRDSTIRHDVPAPVSGSLRFRAVSAGYDFSCALTTEGAAYCWGANSRGQLGNGLTSD